MKTNINIDIEEYERLKRYISYLQEKCNTVYWHYNDYETWCKINDHNNNNINNLFFDFESFKYNCICARATLFPGKTIEEVETILNSMKKE